LKRESDDLSGKETMFKDRFKNSIQNNIVAAFLLVVAFFSIYYLGGDFPAKRFLLLFCGWGAIFYFLTSLLYVPAIPHLFRNSDREISKLVTRHLGKYSNEVIKRFNKGNSGMGQLRNLAEFCAILLKDNTVQEEDLEISLNKIFGSPVHIDYQARYFYIPAIDDDERGGSLTLVVKDHTPVTIKIW